MAEKQDLERREVYFSGRVQGVGFRYTARSIAMNYRVNGFVKNLSDNRVQLVVEGVADEVRAFLNELQGSMQGYVHNVQTSVVPTCGGLRGFEIRF
jgi:acylphosphatase